MWRVGSSSDFNSALFADSVSRSASSSTITRHPPTEGAVAASRTSARTVSTEIVMASVDTWSTSACVPSRAVWQSLQVPQPPRGHTSAAANALAATDRPEPGGPVKSHA